MLETHTHKLTGTYRLEATNSLGSVDKHVSIIVTAEPEEDPTHTADLGAVSVDQLGAYVTKLHAKGNQLFKENYKV